VNAEFVITEMPSEPLTEFLSDTEKRLLALAADVADVAAKRIGDKDGWYDRACGLHLAAIELREALQDDEIGQREKRPEWKQSDDPTMPF
jgi:hypothetical protein